MLLALSLLSITTFAECPEQHLAELCLDACDSSLVECIIRCEHDATCQSSCLRQEAECIASCPCGEKCPNGCIGCASEYCLCTDPERNEQYQNCRGKAEDAYRACSWPCHHDFDCIVECEIAFRYQMDNCPCQTNCPRGCPCDDYECEANVLVLNSRSNASALVSAFGDGQAESVFIGGEWEDITEVQIHESCSVIRNGKVTIFGGREATRQVSVVGKSVDLLNSFIYRIQTTAKSIALVICHSNFALAHVHPMPLTFTSVSA